MKTARDALDQLTRDVLAAYHATDPSGAFEAIKAVLARSLPRPPGRWADDDRLRHIVFAGLVDAVTKHAAARGREARRILDELQAALAATPEAPVPPPGKAMGPLCLDPHPTFPGYFCTKPNHDGDTRNTGEGRFTWTRKRATPEAAPPTCCQGLSPECVAAGKCLHPPVEATPLAFLRQHPNPCNEAGCEIYYPHDHGSGEATPTGAPVVDATHKNRQGQ